MAYPRPEFRADLEGLRGLAILLVVLFHAGVPGLQGGFVGVDVFFVLSGFFITGLLHRESGDTGGINLTEFYGKRGLRLLPPLLVVLLATLIAVMWLYAPIDRAPIASNARAVALYSGNIAFANESLDYFSSGENPLLHTWSLAVEQQFYLFWPMLFVMVGLAFDGPVRSAVGDEKGVARTPLLVAISIAGAVSFAASLVLTGSSQPWAFFGMPTRIWEFALGGILAVFLSTRSVWFSSRGSWLQFAALVGIAFAVSAYDRATPYPGMAALLPAVAAVLLLVGGHLAPASVVTLTLSGSVFRWLGRMSYAWYLWHWPLVGLAEVLNPHIGVWGKLAWCGAALVLAWLTWRFVETPARNGAFSSVPSGKLALASFVATVLVAGIAHGALVMARRGVREPAQRVLAAARNDRMPHDCWANTVEDAKVDCSFGDRNSSTVIVLFGDSHAEHWLGALDRVGKERHWKIILMVKGGCPVADMPELMQVRLKRYYHECTRYREAMVQRIMTMKPAAAILSSWDHYMPVSGDGSEWQVTPEMWRNGLRRTYSRISAAGIPVIAVRGTPRTWFSVPSCLSRREAGLFLAGPCEYERASSLSPLAINAQTEAASGLAVRFVDLNDQICASKRCSVVRNGVVVFTDDNHLTASFSRTVGPVFGARVVAAAKELGRTLP